MIDTVEFGDVCICVFPFTSGESILTRRIGRLRLADASRVRTLWNEKFRL
jgi:hypothetical protein